MFAWTFTPGGAATGLNPTVPAGASSFSLLATYKGGYTTSKSGLGWSADPASVSSNYTIAITTTGNDCAGVAVVAPAYVIKATATGNQAVDGNLCLDSVGQKTPSTKW